MDPSLLTREGDWKCKVCKKKYPTFLSLDRHLQLHFSVKNVNAVKDQPSPKCEACNQYYYSEDALERHMEVIHRFAVTEEAINRDIRQMIDWFNSNEEQTSRFFYCKECNKICNLVQHLYTNIRSGPVDYFD